jgi:hypothetical protein
MTRAIPCGCQKLSSGYLSDSCRSFFFFCAINIARGSSFGSFSEGSYFFLSAAFITSILTLSM